MTTTRITQTSYPVTLAEAKLNMRIDGNDEDSLINMLIAAATNLAETRTRRSFAQTEWRLQLDAFPTEIRLLHPPVTAVSWIRYVDTAGVLQTLDSASYVVDMDCIPAWIVPADGYEWPETLYTYNAVRVTYESGYAPADCPLDVKRFILAYVAEFYRNREALIDGKFVTPSYIDDLLAPWVVAEV